MGWISGPAVFFIIWWTVLFTVLPWRVKKVEKPLLGNEAGAPDKPYIKEKAIATTIFATVIWLIIYFMLEFGIISLDMVRD